MKDGTNLAATKKLGAASCCSKMAEGRGTKPRGMCCKACREKVGCQYLSLGMAEGEELYSNVLSQDFACFRNGSLREGLNRLQVLPKVR